MPLYLFDGKGFFDTGAKQISNGTLTLHLMPKISCPITIGKETLHFVDGVAEVPEKSLVNGINRVQVCGIRCEMLVRSGDTVTPMGFATRDLVKIAYEVDNIKKRLSEFENWKTEHTVDPFI